MRYNYPPEFPEESRNRVLSKELRAVREFDNAKQEASHDAQVEGLLRHCILWVFSTFVEEASELGRQRIWTAHQLESQACEFLRQLTIWIHHEKGYDRSGRPLRDMVSSWDGSILPEVKRMFERSPEWQKYQDILLEVAESQASRLEDQRLSEQMLASKAQVDWADIEICFLSDERVQIYVCGRPGDTKNFAEMGFEDRRGKRGKPNAAWGVLRVLASNDGMIPVTAISGQQDIQKRAQEIRKVLCAQFGLSEDPIPFRDGIGYVAAFKITKSPARDT
jgi:hypothetical protein